MRVKGWCLVMVKVMVDVVRGWFMWWVRLVVKGWFGDHEGLFAGE